MTLFTPAAGFASTDMCTEIVTATKIEHPWQVSILTLVNCFHSFLVVAQAKSNRELTKF